MQRAADLFPEPTRAVWLLFVRIGLVGIATFLGWLLVRTVTPTAEYPPSPLISSIALLPVNILTLWLLARTLRSSGDSLRELFGARRGFGFIKDIGWGLVWIAALYVPFVAAIFGTMFVIHGANTIEAFSTVFFNPNAATVSYPVWALVLGVVAVVTFAPLNAPAEEALYRGYALRRLSSTWPIAAAVSISSLAFGAQHAFFAPTRDATVVYVVAFTVWGVGASLIALKQKRLMPIVVAHFIVNLMTSSPAVIFPALQIAGVIPT
jgi:uncharacterized protein